jgi:2-polyprenyl-6-methoxyphenol hydroxylase-like FAD-dependent oxidoreductase
MPNFDIVVVGGGLGGSSVAVVMARQGAKVLVLEQELRFRDRVRGELLAPWGNAELKKLGLFETLREGGAIELPWLDLGMGPIDLPATTLQMLPGLAYSHPRAQEALISAAEKAGAEVRRGAKVEKIEPGVEPAVTVGTNGSLERITARLIVAADGRNSSARKWGGFKSTRDEHTFLFAGVLLSDVSGRDDLAYIIYNPALGCAAAAIPQGNGQFRGYLGYPASAEYRIQGRDRLALFFSESVKAAPMLAPLYANARDCGPLASFESNESWVDHPYANGVALVGDAAATTDPCYGQGMALTFRDVRVLRDQLSADSDWDRAGHLYAGQHDDYFAKSHIGSGWFRFIFQDQTPAAVAQRQKAMPLIAQDPSRVPDCLNSGPDLPVNDAVRSRFFGES